MQRTGRSALVGSPPCVPCFPDKLSVLPRISQLIICETDCPNFMAKKQTRAARFDDAPDYVLSRTFAKKLGDDLPRRGVLIGMAASSATLGISRRAARHPSCRCQQHAQFRRPNHTRLRGIADEAFRRRAVLDMQPRIRAIADELAADLYLHRAALPTSSSDMRDSCL